MNDNQPIRHTKSRENSGVPLSGSRRHRSQSRPVPQQMLWVLGIAAVILLMLNPVAVMQTASQWRVGAVEDRMVRAVESWQAWMLRLELDQPGEAVREWMREQEHTEWEEVSEALSPVLASCEEEDDNEADLRGPLETVTDSGEPSHDFAAKQGFNLNPVCLFRGLTGNRAVE